jgi:hypothetical protein
MPKPKIINPEPEVFRPNPAILFTKYFIVDVPLPSPDTG